MPGSFTDYSSNSILDMIFSAKPWAPMPMLWIGLSLRKAFKNGEVLEPDANLGYGRTGIVNKPSMWNVVDAVTRKNAFALSWPRPLGPWGEILSMFIADAKRGGHILASIDLDTPKVVTDTAPVLKPGGLVIVANVP